MLAVLAFWQLDLPDFGCDLILDFHAKLLLRTLVPIALLIILGLLAASPKLRTFCGNAAFVVIFLCYPSCTAAVFSTFNCDSFDNGERYLKADYSIDCDSPTHRAYQLFAGVMMVWPLGVPVLYLGVFLFYHARIRASAHFAPAQQARRRSSAWAPGARRASLEPAAVSATADAELAAATGQDGSSGTHQSPPDAGPSQEQEEPDLLAATHELMTGGRMTKGGLGEELPAWVVALISMYEKNFYW